MVAYLYKGMLICRLTIKKTFLLLERKVGKDGSKRLAIRGPVGVEFNNPGDTTVFLQLLLITQ